MKNLNPAIPNIFWKRNAYLSFAGDEHHVVHQVVMSFEGKEFIAFESAKFSEFSTFVDQGHELVFRAFLDKVTTTMWRELRIAKQKHGIVYGGHWIHESALSNVAE
jgi:hypothetical protein